MIIIRVAAMTGAHFRAHGKVLNCVNVEEALPICQLADIICIRTDAATMLSKLIQSTAETEASR